MSLYFVEPYQEGALSVAPTPTVAKNETRSIRGVRSNELTLRGPLSKTMGLELDFAAKNRSGNVGVV